MRIFQAASIPMVGLSLRHGTVGAVEAEAVAIGVDVAGVEYGIPTAGGITAVTTAGVSTSPDATPVTGGVIIWRGPALEEIGVSSAGSPNPRVLKYKKIRQKIKYNNQQ